VLHICQLDALADDPTEAAIQVLTTSPTLILTTTSVIHEITSTPTSTYLNEPPTTSLLPSKSPSDSQNRNICVLMGSVGGSVIVLLLAGIIILQCVILLQWKKNNCIVRERTEQNENMAHFHRAPSEGNERPITTNLSEPRYKHCERDNNISHIYETTSQVLPLNEESGMGDYALPQDCIPSRIAQTSLSIFPAENHPPAKKKSTHRVRFMRSEVLPTAVEGEHDYAVLECGTGDTCGMAWPENEAAQRTVFEPSSEDDDSNHRDTPLQCAMGKESVSTVDGTGQNMCCVLHMHGISIL
jgi:hypothetical protein